MKPYPALIHLLDHFNEKVTIIIIDIINILLDAENETTPNTETHPQFEMI
jgi:hypothetical protein